MHSPIFSPFRRYFSLLVLLTAVSALGLNFFLRKGEAPTDLDEYAWFYSGYYYELAFKKRDFHHPDWKAQDALDHPPLAKYLFGFVRSLQGIHLDNLDFKNWWFREADDDLRVDEFLKKNEKLVPTELLFAGRMLSTLSFIGCAFLLGLMAKSFLGREMALVSVLFFLSSIGVQSLAVQHVADGIFLFLLLFVILIQMKWVIALRNGSPVAGLSLLAGILSSLLFLTKINGISSLGVSAFLGIYCLFENKDVSRACRFKKVLVSGGILATSFVFVSCLLNPSFFSDPIGFAMGMFRHRSERLALQQLLFPTDSILTWYLKISEGASHILIRDDLVYYYLGMPLLLMLFLVGLWRLPFSFSLNRHAAVVFFVNAFCWGLFILYHYKMNWPRYLLLITPFLAVIMGMGGYESVNLLRSIIKSRRDFFIKIPITVFLFLFFMILNKEVTNQKFQATHPEWVVSSSIKTHLAQMGSQREKFYQPYYLHSLATLYHRQGNHQKAVKYHGEVMQLIQQKEGEL